MTAILAEANAREMKKSAQRDATLHCALAVVRRSQKLSPCRRPPFRGHRTAKI